MTPQPIRCPKCGGETRVRKKYTRKRTGREVRYRICRNCNGRFTTALVLVRYGNRTIEDEVVIDYEKLRFNCDKNTIKACLRCTYDHCLLDDNNKPSTQSNA